MEHSTAVVEAAKLQKPVAVVAVAVLEEATSAEAIAASASATSTSGLPEAPSQARDRMDRILLDPPTR